MRIAVAVLLALIIALALVTPLRARDLPEGPWGRQACTLP
jgi:hypothetical protein